MRALLLSTLLMLAGGCSSHVIEPHSLDGKKVVFEGRWNALAKESGQILCATEPKIVDVVDIGDRAVPGHDQIIRVSAVLRWRGLTDREKRWAEKNLVQRAPDGYFINWRETSWQPADAKPEPNQVPEPSSGLAPRRGSL